MSECAIERTEIPDILEDARKLWQFSDPQIANVLGVSKESIHKWRNRKGLESVIAQNLEAIRRLKEHIASGNQFPPRPESHQTVHLGDVPAQIGASGAFAAEAAHKVRQFYEAISSRDTATAWKCLSPDFQGRRWDGFESFHAGYTSFRRLDNLVIAPLEPFAPPSCRVFVYYEDATDLIDMPGFDKWRTAQIGHIGECTSLLNELKKRLIENGASPLDIAQVLISRLFTEQAGNVMHTASKLPRDAFLKALDLETTHQGLLAMPFVAVVVKMPSGQFFIDQLLPVHWARKAPAR